MIESRAESSFVILAVVKIVLLPDTLTGLALDPSFALEHLKITPDLAALIASLADIPLRLWLVYTGAASACRPNMIPNTIAAIILFWFLVIFRLTF